MDRRAFTEEDDYEEDLDDIDFGNYKGIFYDDDPTTKYQDPETGAHFDFEDICGRLTKIKSNRKQVEADNNLSAKDKLRLQLNQLGKGEKSMPQNNRIDTEFADEETEGETSNLEDSTAYIRADPNKSNFLQQYKPLENGLMDESDPSMEENRTQDYHHVNQGLKFKNKFMHRIHQTEEDEENVNLIDSDVGFMAAEQFNALPDDKYNLLEDVYSKVSMR